MGYTPQERDIIQISLESSREFWEKLQENIALKGKFALLEPDERSSRIKKAQETLNEKPRHMMARIHISWSYEINGQLEDATRVLEEMEPIHSGNQLGTLALSQLISLYERQGRYQDAHATYERVARYRPAVCLRMLPHNQVLVCGFSTDISKENSSWFIENFDEKSNFKGKEGGIHLSFLGRIRTRDIKESEGEITEEQHVRLLEKLREYLKDPFREYFKMPDLYKVDPKL